MQEQEQKVQMKKIEFNLEREEIDVEAVAVSKRDVALARAYVELSYMERERLRFIIKNSDYGIRGFAEQVLMIHKVSLLRKLSGERRFQYNEIILIERALGIKIEFERI